MNFNLRMGDLLYRSKDCVEHAGVYLENDMVCHISPDSGVEIVSMHEYSAGQEIKVIHTDLKNQELLESRLRKILRSSNDYSISSNNCEHIASYLIYGRKFSPQLRAAIAGAIVGIFLGRKMSASGLIAMTLLCALTGCVLINSFRNYDQKIPAGSEINLIAI